MTPYARALAHARFMAGALLLAILFVMVVDRYFGHSAIAFAAAVVGLIIANTPMLSHNCPTCGRNLFFHGLFVLPWPKKTCDKCGAELDQS